VCNQFIPTNNIYCVCCPKIWLQTVHTTTGVTWSTLLQKEISATQFNHLIPQMSSISSIPALNMKPPWDLWILDSQGMTVLLLFLVDQSLNQSLVYLNSWQTATVEYHTQHKTSDNYLMISLRFILCMVFNGSKWVKINKILHWVQQVWLQCSFLWSVSYCHICDSWCNSWHVDMVTIHGHV